MKIKTFQLRQVLRLTGLRASQTTEEVMCKDVTVFMKEALIAQSDQINNLQMVKKLEFPDIQLEEHPKEQVGIVILHINDIIMQTDQLLQKMHS